MRFTGLIALTEHRRCVPEIINFSNRIAYEPENIRLIPGRQYGADRLEPIKPVIHHVFPAEQAAAAHELMESNRHIGKLVLSWS